MNKSLLIFAVICSFISLGMSKSLRQTIEVEDLKLGAGKADMLPNIKKEDPELYGYIMEELDRQQTHIELIASENIVSRQVLEAQGSVLTNKYAEGYPGKRYYGGCEYVDKVENLALDRIKKLFNAKYANVQAHSGSQANMAVYKALLKVGDTVMGMSLDQGGHLTHGHKMSFSGQEYKIISYEVNPSTGEIDYEKMRKLALEHKPKMIIAGASAYPRIIDFKKFRDVADEIGAFLFVDMAHIAGLVAAGVHPNPMDYAHVVTTTTHKTLGGPRGGAILTNDEELINKINKIVFPGIQGGPLMHVVAAKAAAFGEALKPEFKERQIQTVKNAKAMCDEFIKLGFTVVGNKTENHLMLVDVKKSLGLTGKAAEKILDSVHITCNKNAIPNDTEKAFVTSGLRIGTPAITTRGFKEEETRKVAQFIDRALRNHDKPEVLEQVKKDVLELLKKFPLYE